MTTINKSFKFIMLNEYEIDKEINSESSRDIELRVTFKSPAFEAIHSSVSGLFRIGAITQEVMCKFDKACISSRNERCSG